MSIPGVFMKEAVDMCMIGTFVVADTRIIEVESGKAAFKVDCVADIEKGGYLVHYNVDTEDAKISMVAASKETRRGGEELQ